LDVAALLEPVSIAYYGLFVTGGGVRPGDYVAVTGTGPVGLAAIALAKCAGAAKVFAIDIVDKKLETGKNHGSRCLHKLCKSSEGKTVVSIINEATDGNGIMLHVEATGAFKFTFPNMQDTLAAAEK
jgi:threonine dehydrogenase-like Zn-dependent dehydrogenase